MVDRLTDAKMNDANPTPVEPKRSPGEELVARLDMRLAVERMRGLLVVPTACDTFSQQEVPADERYGEIEDDCAVRDCDDQSEGARPVGNGVPVARMPAEAGRLHARLYRDMLEIQAAITTAGESPFATEVPDADLSTDEDSEWCPAIVRRFTASQGGCYLSLATGSPDIFIHKETLVRFGVGNLRCGQYVEIKCEEIDGNWIFTGLR